MAKKKQMPAPNPDYVFPIPEANKLLGNAYVFDGQRNLEQTNSRILKSRNKDENRSDNEQLKVAAQDIRVGKEYLSGKRNAFNVQRELHKKNEYMPDLYQPYMETDQGVAIMDTYDWTHSRDDGPEWSGNLVPDVIGEHHDTFADRSPIPSHLQMNQFRKYTKEEDAAGLVWAKESKSKEGHVTNIDYHKNVEQAYKQKSMKAPKAPKASKASKKPKEETGDYLQLSLF